MKKLKNLNKNSGGKVSIKLKSALLLLLVAIFSISGIMTVNAATVKDNGNTRCYSPAALTVWTARSTAIMQNDKV